MDRVGVGEVVPVASVGGTPIATRAALVRSAAGLGIGVAVDPDNTASDHESFADAGLPAARLGSTPYAAYHSAQDVPAVVRPGPAPTGRPGHLGVAAPSSLNRQKFANIRSAASYRHHARRVVGADPVGHEVDALELVAPVRRLQGQPLVGLGRRHVEGEVAQGLHDEAVADEGGALHPVRVPTHHEVGAGADEPPRDVLLDGQRTLGVLVSPVGQHGHHVHAAGESSHVLEQAVELGPVERPRADRHADRARTRLARTGLRGLADGVEPHEAEADAVPLDDRRPTGVGQVAARAERAQAGVGEPVDGLHQRRLAVVAGVVVRQRECVEARRPQALRHPRVGGERVAALGGGAVRRERALEVADGDVGGAEAALHRPERVRRVALRRGPLADPPAEHDVADHGQGGDPGGVRAGRPDRVVGRVA